MRRVIVNSTPLIVLCNADLLNILKEIYGSIIIPKAVFDEVTAKKTAKYLELTVTGTLGVLIKAKQSGIISSVKNAITKIQSNGFYINENIIKLALKQAGEL